MSRRRNTVWFEDFRGRLRFESRASEECQNFTVRKRGKGLKASIVYSFTLEVPHYEPRRVEVRFANGYSRSFPYITVDGPSESPHRYRGGKLCVWEPTDPPENQWIADDGLVEL